MKVKLDFPTKKKMWTPAEVQDWIDAELQNQDLTPQIGNTDWEKLARERETVMNTLYVELGKARTIKTQKTRELTDKCKRIENALIKMTELSNFRKEKGERQAEYIKRLKAHLAGVISQKDRLVNLMGGLATPGVYDALFSKTTNKRSKNHPVPYAKIPDEPKVPEGEAIKEQELVNDSAYESTEE